MRRCLHNSIFDLSILSSDMCVSWFVTFASHEQCVSNDVTVGLICGFGRRTAPLTRSRGRSNNHNRPRLLLAVHHLHASVLLAMRLSPFTRSYRTNRLSQFISHPISSRCMRRRTFRTKVTIARNRTHAHQCMHTRSHHACNMHSTHAQPSNTLVFIHHSHAQSHFHAMCTMRTRLRSYLTLAQLCFLLSHPTDRLCSWLFRCCFRLVSSQLAHGESESAIYFCIRSGVAEIGTKT